MSAALTSNVVGAVSELQFATRAVTLGYEVLMPLVGTQAGYDLVIQRDGEYARVQVKTAAVQYTYKNSNGTVMAPLCGSRKRHLTYRDYDLLGIVCPQLDRMWLFPQTEITQTQTLAKSLNRLSDWDAFIF